MIRKDRIQFIYCSELNIVKQVSKVRLFFALHLAGHKNFSTLFIKLEWMLAKSNGGLDVDASRQTERMRMKITKWEKNAQLRSQTICSNLSTFSNLIILMGTVFSERNLCIFHSQ